MTTHAAAVSQSCYSLCQLDNCSFVLSSTCFVQFKSVMIMSQIQVSILILFILQAYSSYIIYPKIHKRHRRSIDSSLQVEFTADGPNQGFSLNLRKNEHLVTQGALIEWHYPNGTAVITQLQKVFEHLLCTNWSIYTLFALTKSVLGGIAQW